jgi:hypothetical protein
MDFTPKHRNARPDRQNPHSFQSRQVFWFLFWFDGDLIHFQTTIPNRVEKADSPETIDTIDDFQRNPQKNWCARRELNPQPSASETDALSN